MNNFAAATTMPAAPSASMKLLIDTGAQRVLFAEAGKDVADFILGLVAMPLGAVDRLLVPEGGSLGSIGNVYASAEKMDAAHMQSTAARDALLVAPPSLAARRPDPFLSWSARGPAAAPASSVPLFGGGLPPPPNTGGINNFRRPSEANHALPLYLYRCAACQASSLPDQGSRGFVKDMAKYTVMDDLTVTPTTNVSSVALLKSLGVKNLDALVERAVNVGHEEVKIDHRL